MICCLLSLGSGPKLIEETLHLRVGVIAVSNERFLGLVIKIAGKTLAILDPISSGGNLLSQEFRRG